MTNDQNGVQGLDCIFPKQPGEAKPLDIPTFSAKYINARLSYHSKSHLVLSPLSQCIAGSKINDMRLFVNQRSQINADKQPSYNRSHRTSHSGCVTVVIQSEAGI
jgi:hypothetical protein